MILKQHRGSLAFVLWSKRCSTGQGELPAPFRASHELLWSLHNTRVCGQTHLKAELGTGSASANSCHSSLAA